jgi:hypothetical protein
MKELDFLKRFVQNARHLMCFLGARTSRSAGLPTANDIIWDLKVRYYCAQENQDVKSARHQQQSYPKQSSSVHG